MLIPFHIPCNPRKGAIKLPEAIRLLTAGPARVAGFTDRGSMTPGLLADFTLIDDRGYWPHVVTTLKSQPLQNGAGA